YMSGEVDDGNRRYEAALAAIAVGGVDCRPQKATFSSWQVQHIIALPPDAPNPGISLRIGKVELNFDPVWSHLHGNAAVLDAISRRRQEMERIYAEQSMASDRLVIVDGRLTTPSESSSIVGLAKTIHEVYVDPQRQSLLLRLGDCERTP